MIGGLNGVGSKEVHCDRSIELWREREYMRERVIEKQRERIGQRGGRRIPLSFSLLPSLLRKFFFFHYFVLCHITTRYHSS